MSIMMQLPHRNPDGTWNQWLGVPGSQVFRLADPVNPRQVRTFVLRFHGGLGLKTLTGIGDPVLLEIIETTGN